IDGAAPAVVLEHPVAELLHTGRDGQLPPAETLPELLRAVGVLRRELHVHDLPSHAASFRWPHFRLTLYAQRFATKGVRCSRRSSCTSRNPTPSGTSST